LTIEEEVRQAARLLEALIQAAGVTPEELETLLEAPPGYLQRVLSGQVELKLRHVLALLRGLEIEPQVFFQALYPAAGTAGGTVRLEELRERLDDLGLCREPPTDPEIGIGDLEKVVQGAVHAALGKDRLKT
jgi:hypothetical protein